MKGIFSTATVEIVKAALQSNTGGANLLITGDAGRENLLKGIEELYKKLYYLDNKREWTAKVG